MKPLRSAWTLQGYRIFFSAILALVFALPLRADPPDKAGATRKKGAKSPPSTPSARGPSEFADAFPSPPRPVAPDLLLTKGDERKADALAAFSEGVVAEDNAEQEKMIEAYRKALALNGFFFPCQGHLGMALEKAGRRDEAIQLVTVQRVAMGRPLFCEFIRFR